MSFGDWPPAAPLFAHPEEEMPQTIWTTSEMDAPTLNAPMIDNFDHVPIVEGVPIFYTHMAILRSAICFDGAGNMFIIAGLQDGNWTTAYLRKMSWDGRTLLGEWRVPLSHNWKQDGLAAAVTGADLVIAPAGHDVPAVPPPDGRPSVLTATRIVGICQPFRDTSERGGGASEPLPQVPQEIDVTPAELINAMVVALNTRDSPLQVAMSKIVKNNAKIGLAESLNDSFGSTEGSFYKGFGVWKRLDEIIWQTVNKVMKARGLGIDPVQPNIIQRILNRGSN